MGGRPAACCRGFPSCYFHTPCMSGGVAGWNMTPEDVNGFGTLLGPEKTSAGWWVVFSGGRSRPGPSNASLCGVWWWLWWVSGCGGVLSVA